MSVPHERGRGSVIGRALLEGRIVQIPDVLGDTEYKMLKAQSMALFRTVLGVPLMREGKPIGVIALNRLVVQPFTQKQIDLVGTFADQAVIAIENARLFEEVQARTRELQETLEYQTATADVLNVISRSPSELQPVLDAIVQTAARLCAAEYSFIVMCDETTCRLVAANNVELAHIQFIAKNPVDINRDSVTGRTALEKRTIHIPDVLADPEFKRPDWQAVGKQRTVLGVPLLREGKLLGVMILARTEVKPFNDKQVDLVTTSPIKPSSRSRTSAVRGGAGAHARGYRSLSNIRRLRRMCSVSSAGRQQRSSRCLTPLSRRPAAFARPMTHDHLRTEGFSRLPRTAAKSRWTS